MKKHIFILCLFAISLIACDRPRIEVGPDDSEGFFIVKVYGGDTVCPIIWQGNTAVVDSTGEPREGRFFHYHNNYSVITKYICCNLSTFGEIIDGHIDDDVSDSTFLIVDQKPVDSIFGKFIKIYRNNGDYYLRREYDTIQNSWDKQIALDLSHIHQYWIVSKTTKDVYGPFQYEDYLGMKKQLGVPSTLMLKREKYDNAKK